MIELEFKRNLKSFIIWLLILIIMFLVVYLIYPYIMSDNTIKDMDELMKVFPPEMLKAFNIDIASISTAYGWFKSEGFMFVLLIIGFYSSMLGGNILLKEENNKTIEYLNSLPIKRKDIITRKIIVAFIYILLLVMLLMVFNYIALSISGDFNQEQFILLSITPIFVGFPLFGINLLISTLMHKTKKVVGISLGIVFLLYLFNMLSEISTKVEFLKYFSVYTLADVRNVMTDVAINPIMIIISILITLIFVSLSYMIYNKKELL